jgi:glutaredoxin-like YruB-family protein
MALFENAIYTAQAKKEGKKQKSVTVYSTPTCSWCNTLKSYLKKNNIRFRDVDVSKDQKAAEAMVKKSGQQGVPQMEVNGQIVVGFDKVKINQMLEIAG